VTRRTSAIAITGATAMALALFALSGCSSQATARIEVIEPSSGTPVAGALVESRPLGLFLPMHPFTMLDPGKPDGARAVTDDQGVAILDLPRSHAAEITVSTDGESIWRGIAEPAGADADGLPRWNLSRSVDARSFGLGSLRVTIEAAE
jgi:hypothetical protein